MKIYDKDTTAHAVVLKEYGLAYISSTSFNLIYKHHVRVKIFNSKGFDNGNIEILLHKSDANSYEKISEIKGITFNVTENGIISKNNLEPKQIFKENYNKYWDVVKFALPNLQEGSIIEYSYQIESPRVYNFRTWIFQSSIPKIHSEYLAKLPAIYNYNVSLTGYQKLSTQNSKLEKNCFDSGRGFKADCSNMTFIMKNVPAFIEEDYMTASSNFMSAINFELKEYINSNGVKTKLTNDWKDIDYELKTHDSFGKQYTKKSLFKDELVTVIGGISDDLDKAKAIYKHIQSRFRWNNYYGKYSDEGIKKALSKNSGNVGDINLSLVAAMNA
ncbi:MAG: DUF3857 and transglutaminase domain-containing protein, partial [Bacteroidota bacterium]|nr:DUF3857 and transglutaminase domain-containing protein [Bacteroidota bacterium]